MDSVQVEAPILVVDDRRENRLSFVAILSALGQPIVEAVSGEDALRHLLKRRFALILMDVQMPGLDGIETAELIRSREATAHIPIIFVTAIGREMNTVLKGYAKGAVDYLLKPIDPDILRAKVHSFLELYVRGEQLRVRERQLIERERAELEAQRGAELEKQLSAMLGHDIRNPLAVIRTNAQLGQRTGGDCGRHEKYFTRIISTVDRMQRLTDGMLDLARTRAGVGIPVRKTRGSLLPVVTRVLQDFRTLHPERAIEVAVPENVDGCWDSIRISQVLTNLLENAFKYGDPEGLISVEVTTVDEEVVLCVDNEGAQVDDETLARLFDPFARGSQDGGRLSAGLGLFIVKQIAEAHQGRAFAMRLGEDQMRFGVRLSIGPAAECDTVEASHSLP